MRLNEELLKSLPILLGATLLPTPACAVLEQMFLYFPDRGLVTTPETMRLEYEDVFFSAADGTQLHGWYLPGEPGEPVLVFCHMGKELFDRAPQPKSFYSIAGAGHNDTYGVGGAAYWQRWRELVEENF